MEGCMPALFQIKYQLPGGPIVVERGLTREGIDCLQNLILRAGGWGVVVPYHLP
jgi:hypothetical protein